MTQNSLQELLFSFSSLANCSYFYKYIVNFSGQGPGGDPAGPDDGHHALGVTVVGVHCAPAVGSPGGLRLPGSPAQGGEERISHIPGTAGRLVCNSSTSATGADGATRVAAELNVCRTAVPPPLPERLRP